MDVSSDLTKSDIEEIKKLFANQEHEKALKYCDEILEEYPNSADLYFFKASAYSILGQLKNSIAAFKKSLALNPKHVEAAIGLSVLLNDIGHYKEGKDVFASALSKIKKQNDNSTLNEQVNQKFSIKHMEIGDLYLSYDRYDEGIFEFKKASTLDPYNLEARIKLAKALEGKGFALQAIEELRKLKHEHPSYLGARIALGVVYYSSGKIIEAQNEWQQVLNLDPINSQAKKYLDLSQTAKEITL